MGELLAMRQKALHEIYMRTNFAGTCPCTDCEEEREREERERKMNSLSWNYGSGNGLITGSTVPEDLDVKAQGERVGHLERDNTLAHIEQMQQGGYIDEVEADKRRDYAKQAKTRAELTVLTQDLPNRMDKRNLAGRTRTALGNFGDWEKPSTYVPVLATTTAAGLIAAILPGVIADSMHVASHPLALAVWVPLLILGTLTTVASIVGLCVKSID